MNGKKFIKDMLHLSYPRITLLPFLINPIQAEETDGNYTVLLDFKKQSQDSTELVFQETFGHTQQG